MGSWLDRKLKATVPLFESSNLPPWVPLEPLKRKKSEEITGFFICNVCRVSKEPQAAEAAVGRRDLQVMLDQQ